MQEERVRQPEVMRQATSQQQQQNMQPAVDTKTPAVNAMSQAMMNQMQSVLQNQRIAAPQHKKITNVGFIEEREAKRIATMTARNQQLAQAQANLNPQEQIEDIIIPAGTIEYGQLLIEANSDIPGPIVAMIVSGPFQGSRVLGTFNRKEEYLVMQFTTLIDKKGVSIPIQAFALDPDTTLTGMATDVDHRYWERIILPAAADFVQGMGSAYADQQGNQTVVTGDVVVQSKPPINTKEQIAKGIESAAEQVGDVLEDEGSKTQILVRVRAGTPMGILFMTAITDQDRMVGQYNPETARTLNEQKQQQSLFQQSQNSLQGGNNPMYLIQGLQGLQGLQANQGTAAPAAGANGAVPGYGSSTNSSLPPNIFSSQQYMSQQNQ